MTSPIGRFSHPTMQEHLRFTKFLSLCLFDGRISLADKVLISHEANQILDAAGYNERTLATGEAVFDSSDASVAAIRHATHAMRVKLRELHPDLAQEFRNSESRQQIE